MYIDVSRCSESVETPFILPDLTSPNNSHWVLMVRYLQGNHVLNFDGHKTHDWQFLSYYIGINYNAMTNITHSIYIHTAWYYIFYNKYWETF